ncbi:MAG: helix-turn-helix domain-containing protein [Nocardioidaceae bacterium]
MTTTLRPAPPAHETEPLLREVFGEVLRRARRDRGRTLRTVAQASRVSLAYLSEIERGQKEASSEILGAVCTALGISVLDLVTQAHHDLAVRELRPVRVLAAPSRRGGPMAMAA